MLNTVYLRAPASYSGIYVTLESICRCQGTDLSGALCEQPEESLRCLCAAAYEASPDYSLTCIAASPSFAPAILSTAKTEAGCLSLCLPLQQALTGVHSTRVVDVLGMHPPEQAITAHLFNYTASLTSISMIRPSHIGNSHYIQPSDYMAWLLPLLCLKASGVKCSCQQR